jgi:hypothetical protein
MTLRGKAFLCLWNDFDISMSEEYERWHTREHVPERVASPGFLSGRRYAAFDRSEGRYLTLYDLDSMGALDTPEYADLQQNPTPWSARMRQHFQNVLRIPFETVRSEGEGSAAHVAVFAFETDKRNQSLASELAEALAGQREAGQCVAFHVGHASKVPAYGVFGLQEETRPGSHKVIAIQETTTADQASDALRWVQATVKTKAPDAGVLRAETTTLVYSVCHDDVVAKWQRPSAKAVQRLHSGV